MTRITSLALTIGLAMCLGLAGCDDEPNHSPIPTDENDGTETEIGPNSSDEPSLPSSLTYWLGGGLMGYAPLPGSPYRVEVQWLSDGSVSLEGALTPAEGAMDDCAEKVSLILSEESQKLLEQAVLAVPEASCAIPSEFDDVCLAENLAIEDISYSLTYCSQWDDPLFFPAVEQLLNVLLNLTTDAAKNCVDEASSDTDTDGHMDEEFVQSATDLIWLRCPLGTTWDGNSCLGAATPMSWNSAVAACPTPYRLPTKREFMDLLGCADDGCMTTCFENPDCREIFSGMSGHFWSSTVSEDGDNPKQAWLASFDEPSGRAMKKAAQDASHWLDGDVGGGESHPIWVRCVRN